MSEPQWNYLGLTHNPFSDPQKEFFPGADREQLLSKVRRLSQWSRPILTVSGPHGVGKTCVFRALSSSLESGVVAARVNGSLVSRASDVLSALVQGYGVATPAGADAPLLIELIVAHLSDQAQKDRTSLVLVDDAHLLEQRAVDDLVNLADAGAKLAFFSEPQFVESLQRAIERNAETADGDGDGDELLWQEMLLSPFSRDQSSDYLAWRFAEAGYDGKTPFSEHQIDIIHRTSGGYPGRLDFAANEQLMLMTVGGAPTAGIPRKHLWLAGGLACVLGLVLWLWSPGENLEVDKKTVKVEMPKPDDATAVDSAEPAVSPNIASSGSADTVSDTASKTVDLPLSRTVEPVPEAQRPKPEPVISTSRTVRPAPVVRSPVTKEVAPQPVAEPVVAERVPEPTPRPEPKPITKPTPKPTPQSQTSAPTFAYASGVHNAAWLLRQNDASYTIQLVGLSDADRATSYLSEQERPERFALFRTRSGGRVMHVVTFGVYTTSEAAEAAVNRLPSSVGQVNPWVRPIRSVKSAIATTPQGN